MKLQNWMARPQRVVVGFIFGLCLFGSGAAVAGSELHGEWSDLLGEHVTWNAAGSASSVDYAGFQRSKAKLDAYLKALSAVPESTYQQWEQAQQRAFLINAYNAFTVDLILTRYPDLESIKDLGSWFRSPWKQIFIALLGAERSLDEIEHELLRGSPDYDDPRIHFAVNCASIGCPALRPEAYTAAQLDQQLDDQTRRFLSDSQRNRAMPAQQLIAISKIFDWYGDDFEMPFRGSQSLPGFLAQYPQALNLSAADVAALVRGDYEIDYLDYDWSLND